MFIQPVDQWDMAMACIDIARGLPFLLLDDVTINKHVD
jgi:hypothetical protein